MFGVEPISLSRTSRVAISGRNVLARIRSKAFRSCALCVRRAPPLSSKYPSYSMARRLRAG